MAKREFDSKKAESLPMEQRGVNALEHIAHYLDRIEGHLKKLAKPADGGDSHPGRPLQGLHGSAVGPLSK